MSFRLVYPLKGVLPFLVVAGNLSFWICPLFVLALFKLLVPVKETQVFCYRMMSRIYNVAVWIDDQLLWRVMGLRMEVRGLEHLDQNKLYLVLANHQSWADIFILQSLLNFKAPIPKFIFKRQLLFMPVVGLICWAYDFPAVSRYTKEEIVKSPYRKGQDRKSLQASLLQFHKTPGSIVNFAEGTRYASLKARHRQSPYRFLLPPKVGGLTVILQSMGDQLHQILDLTLAYECPQFNFWDFLRGKCRRIIVQVRHIAPEEAFNRSRPYLKDILPAEAAQWIHRLWEEKDQTLQKLRAELTQERLALE
ncbi:MAG: 1-acyl-sn-glycerol-3-phosphate acyltransferase [Deltaproteobacteria bacterium]|nr:1-acyl-sn-glycerol-3-phosphate acyltransferase [Deltaproteobacteria bacterium]